MVLASICTSLRSNFLLSPLSHSCMYAVPSPYCCGFFRSDGLNPSAHICNWPGGRSAADCRVESAKLRSRQYFTAMSAVT